MSDGTNLKTWGSTGSEYPDGYAYEEGEPPVDEYDNYIMTNVIDELDELFTLIDETEYTDEDALGAVNDEISLSASDVTGLDEQVEENKSGLEHSAFAGQRVEMHTITDITLSSGELQLHTLEWDESFDYGGPFVTLTPLRSGGGTVDDIIVRVVTTTVSSTSISINVYNAGDEESELDINILAIGPKEGEDDMVTPIGGESTEE